MSRHSLRRRVYDLLEHPSRAHPWSRALEFALIVLILVSVTEVALETVRPLFAQYAHEFHVVDLIITLIFTVEYIARVWASPEANPDLSPMQARLRYLRSPLAIIDLVAIVPFYLVLITPIDFQLLRVLRLLRIYKLARYSPALSVLFAVIKEEAATLLAAFSILSILLVLAAAGAYFVEHQAQPEAFGSVPAAMWWSMATLTTVGYGDVTPITPLGRVFGGLITLLGVGMAALPAGIIATGLADHLNRRRHLLRDEFRHALEDGHIDLAEGRRIEALRRELGISEEMAHVIHRELRRKQDNKIRKQKELQAHMSNAAHTSVICTCPHCGQSFSHDVASTEGDTR